MLANTSDQRDYWRNISITRAQYSDCGSFCFLKFFSARVLFLDSTFLKIKQAKMQIPAVWGRETSYNGRLYKVGWRDEPTMVSLYQAIDRPHRDGFHDSCGLWLGADYTIAAAITAFPTHLAVAIVYLLADKTGDDLARMLFLPAKGPPEIKYLRVTLNQILAKLEEAARAVESNIEDLFRQEFDEEAEKESSELEPEEAAMSTGEDELGIPDSDLAENKNMESEEAAMSAVEDCLTNMEIDSE